MPLKRHKVNIITLGCPKNIVDSEVLMRQLTANNLELVANSDQSDAVIINTCGFIQSAKQESLETILHAAQLKKEGRIKELIIMGCLAERYSDELRKEIPEIDNCTGANKLDQVIHTLGGNFKYELLSERLLTTPGHYAYLKISEGCDRPCSFCSIPLIRGTHISRPIEKIVEEAQHLADSGVRELILIAQDSTYYGLDLYGRRALAQLLEQLAGISGIEWIRLMYAFPTGFPADVFEQFKNNPNLCRYLDIPFQHISDSVLTSMRRGIGSKEIRLFLDNIRTKIPNIALRTTLIVGYPNEGEKEFEELHHFVKETKFDRLGVFTYSQEEDTFAFQLGDPIPHEVKEERYKIIMETQREITFQNNQQYIGKKITVLVDHSEGSTAVGRTEYDAPEIDNEVTLHDVENLSPGHFYDVEVTDADAYDLFGTLVDKMRHV
ncbi:MAG: 30S ribosomal protein S12 methylthiotransferase RimO [Ignavibacteriales bacterium]|nr:30S ribosomal protein S12 methylthiotransferase RimO [Ignavibacteriales bacterium]